MRLVGTVVKWDDDKRYGFITPRGGGRDVFVHARGCAVGGRPSVGVMVEYEVEEDDRGRKRAHKVSLVDKKQSRGRSKDLRVSALALTALVGLCTLCVLRSQFLLAAWLLTACVLSFGTYAFDKLEASSGGWRVKETTLHILDLLGGWPGALAAQHIFMHKRKKASFQFIYWSTVVLNVFGILAITLLDFQQLLQLELP